MRRRQARCAKRPSDAEYLQRYDLERAYAVAVHARGTDAGTTRLNNPTFWAQVYDDSAHLTRWLRYVGWLEYRYGPVHLQVMNPDGTWRPWAATALAAKQEP